MNVCRTIFNARRFLHWLYLTREKLFARSHVRSKFCTRILSASSALNNAYVHTNIKCSPVKVMDHKYKYCLYTTMRPHADNGKLCEIKVITYCAWMSFNAANYNFYTHARKRERGVYYLICNADFRHSVIIANARLYIL